MTIARAIAARCFCPPDRSDGYLAMNCSAGARPTVSRTPATRCRYSSPDASLWIFSGWPTDCSIVIAGFRDACGSWNTICIRRRSGRSCAFGHRRDLVPVENHAAIRRTHESEDGAPERRLPTPRLADETEHLAAPELERDVVHCPHVTGLPAEEPRAEPAADGVVRLEVTDRDERVGVGLRPHRPPRSPHARVERFPPRDLRLRPVQPAGDAATVVEAHLTRLLLRAHPHRARTARVETAAGRADR